MLKLLKLLPSRPNLIHIIKPINPSKSLERGSFARKIKIEKYDKDFKKSKIAELN